MTDKIEIEKIRINLETDKIRLFDEKNSLVAKKKELRTKIVTLNTAGFFNVLIYGHQDPSLGPIRDKFKAKRLPPFDGLKENF